MEKPGFRKYILLQNDDIYKITGIIHDPSIQGSIREEKFARNKLIIDGILILLYITVMTFGTFLIVKIFAPIYQRFYVNHYLSGVYDPNFWIKSEAYVILPSIIWNFLWLIAAPAIMKAFRSLSGLRWHYIQFESVKSEERDELREEDRYPDLYNNNMAFQCDRFFNRDSKKVKAINDDRYLDFDESFAFKAVRFLYYCYLAAGIPLITAATLYNQGLENSNAVTAFLINLAASGLLYLLSHLSAYANWKKSSGVS